MYEEYFLDSDIEAFFNKTSVVRATCDARARDQVGGSLVPVDVQGACSYTVFAGPRLEYVVQFRLESLALSIEVASLATEVYASLAPRVSFEGKIGEKGNEPFHVYVMNRVRGMTHLDFILAYGFPEDSLGNISWRKNLIRSVAHFMASSWKSPQPVTPEYRGLLKRTYVKDLQILRAALPARFQHAIQTCLDSIHDIMSLPMVRPCPYFILSCE
ncbi:hypothetical protein GGR57DRAFT_505754 [Xylariaceae sp. FL1272]|nr:hypothetical protein GGR57DRAFT_505754 [Xylariaceae sp. FL1272]